MHAHRIANRRKCRRMNLLCILSGCPQGRGKGTFQFLLYFCTAKNRTTPRGRSQSIGKPHRVSRPQTRKMFDPFSAATCAWQKTLCAERASNCPLSADNRGAERSESFSKKWLCHFFDSLRERPRGVVLCQPLIVDVHHAADRGAADARRHVGRAGLDRLELAVRADRHHGGVLA